MKYIPTNATHRESHLPQCESWTHWRNRMRKKGVKLPVELTTWPGFKELNPIPREYLTGLVDMSPGLKDKAGGYTVENGGWILRPKRREWDD